VTPPLRRESTWLSVRVAGLERPRLAITTAAESAARDRDAITNGGIPSRALMRVAGQHAAAQIAQRFAGRLSRGVAIFAGPGNNGGDAWVVAAALAAAGVSIRIHEAEPARTADAVAEKARAVPVCGTVAPTGGERLVIDGVLGSGAVGAPRGAVADAIARMRAARADGATVVALDLPSGLDATTGAATDDNVVIADATLCFGTLKRGLLRRRDLAGTIAVLDIGLGASAQLPDGAALLVDEPWVRALLPAIGADAHKGSRGRVVILGGASGMVGATVLASRAALASGAGLVKVLCAPESVGPLAQAVPSVLTGTLTSDRDALASAIDTWNADAILVGPGMGTAGARQIVESIAAISHAPVILDADALNALADDAAALRALFGPRALLTPHYAEAARLLGVTTAEVAAEPYAAASQLASVSGATVLLKGVPTIITGGDDATLVVPRGTPALATGGSGDVLGGIIAAVQGQGQFAEWDTAAAIGAWAHGVAAERAGMGQRIRGLTLEDVLVALPTVWNTADAAPLAPVLAELPRIPD
jgi:NAD(P)H-hydrate epimerase